MRILFITANPFLPQLHGGMQSSAHELCRTLQQRGHHVAVLGGFMRDDLLGFRCRVQKKIFRRAVSRDSVLGYPVWRAYSPWENVAYVAKNERPDLIVVMAVESVRMALAAQRTKIPILMQLQDVEFQALGGRFEDLGKQVPCVANSQFTAKNYRDAYGVNPIVIFPFISPDNYRTKTTGENVTFINPHPLKGRDIALEVARQCPDIPFTFVESWQLSAEDRQHLVENLVELPNVTHLPPQKDMRKVYGKCKMLLAPSVWLEGYGRVVTEAQFSGIPVIASRRGGLPEAVGKGGILLDPEGPVDEWVAAVRKLWQDNAYRAELSAAALTHAERPENSLSQKLDRWEQILSDVSIAPPSGSVGGAGRSALPADGKRLVPLTPNPISRFYARVAAAIRKRVPRALGYRARMNGRDAWESRFPGLRIHGTTRRRIHLTFDDGPHLVNTPRLLEELKQAGIRATFFVMGKKLQTPEGMELVRRAVAEGHQIGNHTFSHPHLTELNEDQIREQILSTEGLIGALDNGVKLFRPPYNDHNSLVDQVVESLGYRMVSWNVDSKDWHPEYKSEWVERAMEQIAAQRDSIVLLHDFSAVTVENFGEFIASVRKLSDGRFIAPSEAFPPARRWPGNSYLRMLIPLRWRGTNSALRAQS
jgi:peptidoglycan/xylan/chitin deacetylase (PgdA/CDA1 family)/glycosyltransferase involved in cell wall biosynthesis